MWCRVTKFDPRACRIADRHYSRRKPGSNQFMPPGQTVVLLAQTLDAVFGWWRPHPDSNLPAMNGRDGWTCTIFRNESARLSSEMILEAERFIVGRYDIGPDGLMTYIAEAKVRSPNPGYCFKIAGYRTVSRSSRGRFLLLQKLLRPEQRTPPHPAPRQLCLPLEVA